MITIFSVRFLNRCICKAEQSDTKRAKKKILTVTEKIDFFYIYPFRADYNTGIKGLSYREVQSVDIGHSSRCNIFIVGDILHLRSLIRCHSTLPRANISTHGNLCFVCHPALLHNIDREMNMRPIYVSLRELSLKLRSNIARVFLTWRNALFRRRDHKNMKLKNISFHVKHLEVLASIPLKGDQALN